MFGEKNAVFSRLLKTDVPATRLPGLQDVLL